MQRTGAILLAGGRSTRMGVSKAELPLGDQLLAELVAAVLRKAVAGPVVVVAAQGQSLPALPGLLTAVDRQPDRGPLEGLAAGLLALAGRAEIAFASAVDVPFLSPRLVELVLRSIGDADAAVPLVGGQAYPLTAAYRVSCAAAVEARLARDELRLRSVLDDLRVRWIGEQELRDVDPTLDSLSNLNTPEEYERALAYAATRSAWA